uniref:Uncharacterized protein n=1 Tax=Plectus sambesii TaxID=2011161 RepID=A0A914X416_9BILA
MLNPATIACNYDSTWIIKVKCMKPSSKSSTRSSSSTLDTASTPGDRRSIASASSGTSTLVAEGNSLRSTTPSGQLRK